MSLMYVNEHLSCKDYAKDENVIFRKLFIGVGESTIRKFLHETLLVFIVKGKLEIECGNDERLLIDEGKIFLLPKNFDIRINGLKDTEVIVCSFSTEINLCSQFSLKQLDIYITEDFHDKLFCISFDDRIKRFVDLLQLALSEGLSCRHYHKLKREELFIYLRAGYTKEELAAFFRPVISQNMDFKDFVLSHYKEIRDIKDFALKANMSLSTFNRNFKSTFNETAQKWLLARKSESILADIVMTNMTFQEISDKYNFSSSSYFVAFCRKNFNASPNQIRKNKGVGEPE